ncbi:hypothetical protein Spith_0401 [Spirochaeta thermophila DSM 6578]|uniref:Tagaturonate/fructuronate epimerase n=1 Tax=Winmispira thermophila (strain ATCC 700085 / DSM 6578 / Z-1203) TaxID=869211 RepID=G0GEJ7_WINT7|nr:tagaturonate epimerase family protein [Spirochaeta thermophila]AEJ60685.1 hypothetical protein Spith_0401 [Spirochaeta thermophila DSM 6578]
MTTPGSLSLPRYSIGTGDRFGHEAEAQLRAVIEAERLGMALGIVWNKSYREHTIIGSRPEDVRRMADKAVSALEWEGPYFVDADHITTKTVELFLDSSDFFTIDVAEAIGQEEISPQEEEDLLSSLDDLLNRELAIPGLSNPLTISEETARETIRAYWPAVREAARIHQRIEKGTSRPFVVEVSMDETADPQRPPELLLILAMIRKAGIPARTIAPKFSGSFYKGVDYVGDPEVFAREFEDDLCVVRYAREAFRLPEGLKLSVHSGSDKFSLYPLIKDILSRHPQEGVHLKTAGTTWLEEVTGLAESGGEALALAKEIALTCYSMIEELCAPYAAVIDINPDRLPSPGEIEDWSSGRFVEALEHDPSNPSYNRDFRQLIHVGYKVAAQMGERFHEALEAHREVIAARVTRNLLERHIIPLFPGGAA